MFYLNATLIINSQQQFITSPRLPKATYANGGKVDVFWCSHPTVQVYAMHLTTFRHQTMPPDTQISLIHTTLSPTQYH